MERKLHQDIHEGNVLSKESFFSFCPSPFTLDLLSYCTFCYFEFLPSVHLKKGTIHESCTNFTLWNILPCSSVCADVWILVYAVTRPSTKTIRSSFWCFTMAETALIECTSLMSGNWRKRWNIVFFFLCMVEVNKSGTQCRSHSWTRQMGKGNETE